MIEQHARNLLRQALANPVADFREGQLEAICRLVDGRERLLVIQRTGWGKSIVYFIAARILRERGAGPTLLISPLLSLMRNQLLMAERLGVRAATINSDNHEEWAAVEHMLDEDQLDVLLVSPERLSSERFRTRIPGRIANVGMLVVDEAHCVSDWGHDFRPDYLRIGRMLRVLPSGTPLLATTATANGRVLDDLREQYGPQLKVLRGPLLRSSLRLQNIKPLDYASRMAWLAEHLPNLPGSGIIYALTISAARTLAGWLQARGIAAHAYWAGLANDKRQALEDDLLNNRLKALVATTALGMGFDKPDLGFVIHFGRPSSPVAYYQQVGRAGRAIDEAYGVLLSGENDDATNSAFMDRSGEIEKYIGLLLGALRRAEDGLARDELDQNLNLSKDKINAALKSLGAMSPSPVTASGERIYATPVPYVPRYEQGKRLAALRHAESEQMRRYCANRECLMLFLAHELGDPTGEPCGRCAVCLRRPILPTGHSRRLAAAAKRFLHRNEQRIIPHTEWPGNALAAYSWTGVIAPELQSAEGRALCLWGDAGWSALVREGKQKKGKFDDKLVRAAARMMSERWQPTPAPTWVTCVPSLNHPLLVPDFARRLAQWLDLPFVAAISKARPSQPQKEMENSYQQAHNLAGVFVVDKALARSGPALLVDDIVDSGWTFAIIGALLRSAGSGPIYPLALALTAGGDND